MAMCVLWKHAAQLELGNHKQTIKGVGESKQILSLVDPTWFDWAASPSVAVIFPAQTNSHESYTRAQQLLLWRYLLHLADQQMVIFSLTLVPTTTSGTPRLWLNTEGSRGMDTPLPPVEGWVESADPTFSGSTYPWKCDTTEGMKRKAPITAFVPALYCCICIVNKKI